MKTILYQPIFINPQAYFVFPSLYHIEKGDSFIEPANITGQLIINTLTDDPIILTVKDNNQVDFSIFAGKHIRISQYTDEGAVVLGEWLMPGESTPVYPDWFTSSVKAIYDPAKQGMTNFDVIEAYVEDFTNWYYVKARGVATISQHKFIITKCILKGLSIVEDTQEPYSNLTVRIIGITDNQEVLITDYVNEQHQIINTITEDGIYTIEDRHHFVGFGCNFVGTCNITIEQLPTSILKDLSGNGNHAYLYGGKGKLNSGMGLYKVDFTSWKFYPSLNTVEYYHNKLVIKKAPDTKNLCAHTFTDKFTAKISNIPDGTNLYYKYYDRINKKNVSILLHNGINEIDYTNADGNIAATCMFIISKDVDFNITIEQIPDCPDQLCYDGSMYAVCYGFPILTDYTVMAERTWFEKQNGAFISKSNNPGQGAFIFENILSGAQNTYSFAQPNSISIQDGISYQTKNSYNGSSLSVGTGFDNPNLVIGRMRDTSEVYYVGCHGKIIIADRSFTEEEINWLKENIYNIEI